MAAFMVRFEPSTGTLVINMNFNERVFAALRNAQPVRVPVLEFVVDEKIAKAAVPDCLDVADCMYRLNMDGVGCGVPSLKAVRAET